MHLSVLIICVHLHIFLGMHSFWKAISSHCFGIQTLKLPLVAERIKQKNFLVWHARFLGTWSQPSCWMSSLSPSSLTCVSATLRLGWSGGVCFLTTQSPKAEGAKERSLLPVGKRGGLLILPLFLPDSLGSHSVLTRTRSPGLNCVP